MRKIKFLALVLAVVIMCAAIPSCAEVVTKTDVRFAAIIDIPVTTDEKDENGDPIVEFKEEILVDVLQADITGTSDDLPMVLDAVVQILEQNGIRHKVEDETSITSIDGKAETTRGGFEYVWEYSVKIKDPKNPERYIDVNEERRRNNENELRANEIAVEDGMRIVYHLKAAVPKDAEAPAESAE